MFHKKIDVHSFIYAQAFLNSFVDYFVAKSE